MTLKKKRCKINKKKRIRIGNEEKIAIKLHFSSVLMRLRPLALPLSLSQKQESFL